VALITNWELFLLTGINIFLDGFVPTENLRFRDESLVFKVSESATEEEVKRMNHYEYPHMIKVCRFKKTEPNNMQLFTRMKNA
jgi:translation initiation factor RLI1